MAENVQAAGQRLLEEYDGAEATNVSIQRNHGVHDSH
jgi:hypothetical protein